MTERNASHDPAPRSGRIERWFARIGLAAAVTLLLALIFALDILLTDGPKRLGIRPSQELDLVGRDGRELGWAEGGLRLALDPFTVYDYEPRQNVGGYRINSLGLRGDELQPAADRSRVLIVGGSAAFGLAASEERTFPALLDRRLERYQVLNGGVVGFLSGQELARVVFKLLDLQPDVVVAFNGWNDVYDPYWWALFGGGSAGRNGVNVTFGSIENRLFELRRVEQEPSAALLETALTLTRNSTLLSAAYGSLARQPSPEVPSLDEAWVEAIAATYVSNMVTLKDVVGSRGGRLIVFLQPEQGQFLDATARRQQIDTRPDFEPQDGYWRRFPQLYTTFRRRAAALLAQRGVEVIDGSERILETGAAGEQLFVDPVHLSPGGHATVSRLLEAALP